MHFQGGGFSEDMRVRTQTPTAWSMVSGYCHRIKLPLEGPGVKAHYEVDRLNEVIEKVAKNSNKDKKSGLGSSEDVSTVL